MNCPSCGAALDAAGVDLETSVVRCANCGRETRLSLGESVEQPVEPPAKTRVVIDRSRPGQIALFVPGQGGCFFLIFAAFWLTIVSVMTAAFSKAGGFMLLFLVPFWIAGLGMLLVGLFIRFGVTGVYIDREQFIITRKLFNKGWTRRGATKDISAIRLTEAYKQNDRPVMAVGIAAAANSYSFGSFLSDEEKRWIAFELRAFMNELGHPVGGADRSG